MDLNQPYQVAECQGRPKHETQEVGMTKGLVRCEGNPRWEKR